MYVCVYNDDSLQWFSFIIGSKEEMENATFTPPRTVLSRKHTLTNTTNNPPAKKRKTNFTPSELHIDCT